MRYLLFYLLTIQTWCISQTELRSFFSKKEYSKIVNSFKRNPGAFQNASRLNILGQAQMQLGQTKAAVRSCAKAMVQQPFKQCANILRNLRKQNKQVYDSELASFYHETGDHQAAFSKYYRLYRKYSANDDYRVGLIKVMISQDHIDTAQELTWSLDKNNKKSAHYRGLLKYRLEVLKREKKDSDEQSILLNPAASYKIVFLSQAIIEPHFTVLLQYYESSYNDSKLELGDSELMYLANLYAIKEDFSSAWEIIDNYGESLVEPRAQISLESLLSRLPKRGKYNEVAVMEDVTSEVQTADLPESTKSEGAKPPDKRFVPLELSELDLATPGDLGPFDKLSDDYFKKMKQMKTYAQKRWLYDQVSDKLTEMWSHHVDPSKHAIAAYFETPKGKKFLDEMEAKHAYYEKEDKRNAKMFNGRLSKIDSGLISASDRAAKIQLLRDFRREWSAYQNSTNASVRGAWKKYLDSGEGIRLLKRVKQEIQEYNLTGGKMSYSEVSRQY